MKNKEQIMTMDNDELINLACEIDNAHSLMKSFDDMQIEYINDNEKFKTLGYMIQRWNEIN